MRFWLAAGALIGAQLLDIATSAVGFAHGNVEVNPLAHDLGTLTLLKVAATWLVLDFYALTDRHWRLAAEVVGAGILLASGALLAVAGHNLAIA